MFNLFIPKEVREAEKEAKRLRLVSENLKIADKLDRELSFYKGTYCMSSQGLVYLYLRIQYDKERDEIQFVTRNGNTPEGMIAVANYEYFDAQSKLSRDKIRFLEFVDTTRRLGIDIKYS